MAETVIMPKLGFDMAEGTLVRWVKVEGDPVAKGEVLAEIETDKATVEVESTYSGVVNRHLVEKGAVVPVGTPIAIIAAPDETVDVSQGATPTATPVQAPAEKTTTEVKPKGEIGPVDGKGKEAQSAEAASPEKKAEQPAGEVHASPLARRIARDKGVDLSQVQGTGPGGRIVRRDLESIQAMPAMVKPQAPAPVQPAPAAAPAAPAWVPGATVLKEESIPLGRLRAAIGRRMVESKQQVPHFYVTRAYDLDPLMALRKQVNAALPEDQKISVNDFIVKATALTMTQYPQLNASIEGDHIQRHEHVNVGVAVAVEGGLMTVVSRDADQKPLRVISAEVRDMAARARAGKVRPTDIEGSTISISNLGMYDIDEFVAIINPPEAAILAIGTARQEPVVVDGEIKIGTRLKATISADHRVTDGAEAAQFMRDLAQFLENPLRLLL